MVSFTGSSILSMELRRNKMPKNNISIQDQLFVIAVLKEVERARRLFPGNKMMLAAFSEEAGEVAKAFIDHDRGKETAENLVTECVQAAAMALRCAIEGDASFKHNKLAPMEAKTEEHGIDASTT